MNDKIPMILPQHLTPRATKPHPVTGRHEFPSRSSPGPPGLLILTSGTRTCDAEAVPESVLLHGEHPSNDAADGGQGEQGVADGLGDGADGRVGAPVAGHHVGVEVRVLKHDGGRAAPHEDPSLHLAVNPLRGAWARKGATSLSQRTPSLADLSLQGKAAEQHWGPGLWGQRRSLLFPGTQRPRPRV